MLVELESRAITVVSEGIKTVLKISGQNAPNADNKYAEIVMSIRVFQYIPDILNYRELGGIQQTFRFDLFTEIMAYKRDTLGDICYHEMGKTWDNDTYCELFCYSVPGLMKNHDRFWQKIRRHPLEYLFEYMVDHVNKKGHSPDKVMLRYNIAIASNLYLKLAHWDKPVL